MARHVPLNHAEMKLTARTAGESGTAEPMGIDPAAPVLVHDFCRWTGTHPVCRVRHVLAPETEVRNRAE
ncbi:MAG TPA: hypothetical protein PLL33_14230 [Paracoccus sp. (in: a-proteobacteria)]|nr:hypothetical protein [Paracoccus sp. (in: a-proteobacteria)]